MAEHISSYGLKPQAKKIVRRCYGCVKENKIINCIIAKLEFLIWYLNLWKIRNKIVSKATIKEIEYSMI